MNHFNVISFGKGTAFSVAFSRGIKAFLSLKVVLKSTASFVTSVGY